MAATSSRTPAASPAAAPCAGQLAVPEGAAHGYELVEQLTALPQRRPRHGMNPHSLPRISGSSSAADRWQPSKWGGDSGQDWGDNHALAQRWLDADADSSSIEGFCAADLHPAADGHLAADLHPAATLLQLGPAASALVQVLAGLPMQIEQDRETTANAASLLSAAAQAPPAQRHDHSSMHGGEAQELQDYSLQDSFARGHFGEGRVL